ncbi:MAG TPA: transcription antitermination factor NusB [Lachnospiraceae bacterium]|nr:transcription antitermination factor NusB [Lachnospiraceae bacterium]
MTRKKFRENLYIMLFRLDFYDREELSGQTDIYLEDEIENASEKDKKELRNKFNSILSHLDKIDAQIEEKSNGWTVKRISKAELTVLRLAIFEILYDDDVPDGVAINEAVELSKIYCAGKAKGFVNGILASVVRGKESNVEQDYAGD